MKQLICVKWGNKYGPEYVNRLYAMARRHATGPMRLVCLTDDAQGLRPEIDAFALPELGCEHPQHTMGKWRKLVLWGGNIPALTGLEGPVLFVDLDTVIVGPIDAYFSHGDPERVYLARNWSKPLHRLGQTSVFRYPVGRNPQILDSFRASPQAIADRLRFEQHYITESVPGGIKFWPERWTRHFRLHCLPPFPLRYFMQAKLPGDARMVTFAGGPNPSDVQLGRWEDDQAAFPSRIEHVKESLRADRKLRQLRRFVLPVDWIEKHWVE
jgi:hypothetical protein